MSETEQSKRVLVPLAHGFEEIEAVTIIDILRRSGAEVVTAGLTGRQVTGNHNITLSTDSILQDELDADWDMVVLPGGVPGAPALAKDNGLLDFIQSMRKKGKFTAAVCAAPHVLEKAGITRGKRVTSHPDWAKHMESAIHTGERTVVDDTLVTGQAAGAAMEFAFELVRVLYDDDRVKEVNRGVLARLDKLDELQTT